MRRYIAVWNADTSAYRIAFRDENDPIYVYFVDHDFAEIRDGNRVSIIVAALNVAGV